MSTDGAAGGEAVEIASMLGPVHCRWHAGAGPSAVIMVGGGDGGFDGPAEALYPTLASDLNELGIGALRLDFRIHRFPGPIEDGVLDVCAGIEALARRGIERIGLLGHSFGGAVVIEAAAREPERVTSVATLASQTAGALRVGELAPRPILLVHGMDDTRLPAACSEMLFERAGEPRRLELLEGATHSLRQRREDVRRMLVEWFGRTLRTSA
ncbi:MAG: alpha/beta fold hydrolase [Dehalococcoidia bacterium]